MKYCPKCKAEVEKGFDICWNCSYSFTDDEIVEFKEDNDKKDINCLRCTDVAMVYAGNFKFHEGTRLGVLGSLFEVFVNRESFDLYLCPKCGKVEFFSPEI